MASEFRGDDLQSHSATSKRAGEGVGDSTVLCSRSVGRVASVDHVSTQLAAGGMKLASAKRRCNPGFGDVQVRIVRCQGP